MELLGPSKFVTILIRIEITERFLKKVWVMP